MNQRGGALQQHTDDQGKATNEYRYDARGRLIEKTTHSNGFRAQHWRYQWNADDRMVGLETPEGERYRYTYDALGRRIAKQSESSTQQKQRNNAQHIRYLWDGATMVEEVPLHADGTPAWQHATTWHYQADSFVPLAKQSHENDQLYYIVTDHLGTPRELVEEDGTPVWRQQYSVWGKPLQAANDAPIDCAIRFQGQYQDAESGLYYNYQRYYDPDTSQYLTPDPIGLLGGTRPHGYVHNPNGWVDPLGLAACQARYERYKFLRSQGFSAQDAARYSKGSSNMHVAERHGPHISNSDLVRRARVGKLPDTGQIPRYIQRGASPPDSTKFSSWDNFKAAYDAAHQQVPQGGGVVNVDMGRTMGVGVDSIGKNNRIPGVRDSLTSVRAVFNDSGELVTLFPHLN